MNCFECKRQENNCQLQCTLSTGQQNNHKRNRNERRKTFILFVKLFSPPTGAFLRAHKGRLKAPKLVLLSLSLSLSPSLQSSTSRGWVSWSRVTLQGPSWTIRTRTQNDLLCSLARSLPELVNMVLTCHGQSQLTATSFNCSSPFSPATSVSNFLFLFSYLRLTTFRLRTTCH